MQTARLLDLRPRCFLSTTDLLVLILPKQEYPIVAVLNRKRSDGYMTGYVRLLQPDGTKVDVPAHVVTTSCFILN